MLFRDILMVAATQGGGAAAAPGGVFPFPVCTIGVESDWILTGDWSWDAGTSSIRINGSAGSATLTGAAKTALDGVVANSTLYTLTVTAAGFVEGGLFAVNLKGNASGSFEFEGDGESLTGSTSGTGSGIVFTVDGGTPNLRLTTFTLAPG
jgi:hypothetical protein